MNVPEEAPRFGRLDASPLGVESVEARFDLSLYAFESEGSIHLDAVYKSDLFDAWRIRELLDQLTLALEQAADAPDRALADISLVTRSSRADLPDDSTSLPSLWRGAVHDLFAREASRDPAALAVVEVPAMREPPVAWSYQELDARANQLARWLLDHGVRAGDVVAIYAHRSASTVWAMLGAMKAGAAIAMLDPAHPTARLASCLEQAHPRAFIQIESAGDPPRALLDLVETRLRAARVALPRLDELSARDPFTGVLATPQGIEVGPDDLACVTFTSGSTGAPKGVRGRHGSLSHFQPFMQQRFGIGRGDRFSMLSGLAHDPIQRDVFTPLMAGATLCVPRAEDLEASRLAAWVARARVTVMGLTPEAEPE